MFLSLTKPTMKSHSFTFVILRDPPALSFHMPTNRNVILNDASMWKVVYKTYLGNSVKNTTLLTMKISCSAKEFYVKLNFPKCECCIDGLHGLLQG
jgi:hypothetical protein